MSDGLEIGGIGRGGDIARAVTRILPAAPPAASKEPRASWVGAVRETSVETRPEAKPKPAATSPVADPAALDAARDSIAAVLDGAATKPATAVPMPLAPGSSEDSIAAAQALAHLIAANARPALASQARLDPRMVFAAIAAVD